MKINGRFTYDTSSQRDLQFYTQIREIDLHRRIHVGDESKLKVIYLDQSVVEQFYKKVSKSTFQETTACMVWKFCLKGP